MSSALPERGATQTTELNTPFLPDDDYRPPLDRQTQMASSIELNSIPSSSSHYGRTREDEDEDELDHRARLLAEQELDSDHDSDDHGLASLRRDLEKMEDDDKDGGVEDMIRKVSTLVTFSTGRPPVEVEEISRELTSSRADSGPSALARGHSSEPVSGLHRILPLHPI